MIIVGAGLLGTALARYRGFARAGLPPRRHVRQLGDGDRRQLRQTGDACAASHELEEFCREERSTSPWSPCRPARPRARCERLAAAGVKAVLNFAPVKVHAPEDVLVRQVDLSSELMSLSFYLDREQD